MPQCCAVPYCSSAKGGHRFPCDKSRLKKWIIAIRRQNFIPSKHSVVCKDHFTSEDYTLPKDSTCQNPTPRLKKEAVPSVFFWNISHVNDQKKIECNQRVIRRRQKREEQEKKVVYNLDQWYQNRSTKENIECVEVEIESMFKDIGIQCSTGDLCKDIMIPEKQPHLYSEKCIRNMDSFCIQNLSGPKEVHFYTGCDDYEHFMFIFSLFGEEVNDLKYYPTMKPSHGAHVLTPFNEFFLTVMKLRRNTSNIELSFRFKISESSVSNIFITWINYLYCKLKDLNLWVSKKVLDNNMKILGKTNTCTIIIDCTEIKIEKPKNPASQQLTYSNYKSTNTLKVLVGVSATGCVTFVSDAYGGSISDRQLFEKSNIIL
ncbi:unnamed protein product [Parnassius mnemosyne]|uniref:THAP-type domain-containing protein n=1 Tax=Parnassius mnemosyne TaxID=213953 RepID=A0AAV1KUB9_9NEOP